MATLRRHAAGDVTHDGAGSDGGRGAELAAALRPATSCSSSGELGAGKTTFVRGALRALGVHGGGDEPDVRDRRPLRGRAPGRWRTSTCTAWPGLDDEDPGLLDPYFGPGTVTFVEWPERAASIEALGGRAVAGASSLAHAGGDDAPGGGPAGVILLALDSATPASVAGVLLADGRVVEARDDPPPGSRGEHAARLLPLAEHVLREAGVAWDELERIAVGVGPGGFTGLRIGVATARALAQASACPSSR